MIESNSQKTFLSFVLCTNMAALTSGENHLLQPILQPHSQALSSLPPLVVGIKTLVAAGHMTTQNLGGKKICWTGWVAECFDCCCGKFCGFQNLEQRLKTTRFIGV